MTSDPLPECHMSCTRCIRDIDDCQRVLDCNDGLADVTNLIILLSLRQSGAAAARLHPVLVLLAFSLAVSCARACS
jgi:hypothetical protein